MRKLTFTENAGEGIGTLIISGLKVAHGRHDPLGKIWASVRKRIRENYKVDVVGLFTYDDARKIVSCSFCLNYYVTEMKQLNEKVYTVRYMDSFPFQMADFEDVVIAFVDDEENGLTAYEKLVKAGATNRQLDQLLNRFLLSVNMRTVSEQKRSERRHEKRAKEVQSDSAT